jgi:hypothetical protein
MTRRIALQMIKNKSLIPGKPLKGVEGQASE